MSKGSSPRSCFSKDFKKNYDSINWGKPKKVEKKKKTVKQKIFQILRPLGDRIFLW